MRKSRKRQTAYDRSLQALERESKRQSMATYAATALALRRHWGRGKKAVLQLFELSAAVWNDCTAWLGWSWQVAVALDVLRELADTDATDGETACKSAQLCAKSLLSIYLAQNLCRISPKKIRKF